MEMRHIAVLWSFDNSEIKELKEFLKREPTEEDLKYLVENILERYGNSEGVYNLAVDLRDSGYQKRIHLRVFYS